MEWMVADEEAMVALGRQVGAALDEGAVLGLVGGLGAGKTRFCKGLAEGLGYTGAVTSPTFPLLHEYLGGRLPVFHFDFYRLDGEGELLGIGWDECLDESGVVVAEWADRFPQLMPAGTRWLHFELLDEGGRRVREGS